MRVQITTPIETLALVIVKARNFEDSIDEDQEDDVEGDEEELERVGAGEGEDVDELEDDELTEVLATMSDNQLAELLALTWVGGGDYDEEDWDDALSSARSLTGDEVLANLLGAADLSDLIENGLVQLGYAVLIEDDGAAAA